MAELEEMVLMSKKDVEALAARMSEAAKKQNGPNSVQVELSRRIPATLTVNDILLHYGIGRGKWLKGVKSGLFPKPIKGFERPKRWRRSEVESALGLNEAA